MIDKDYNRIVNLVNFSAFVFTHNNFIDNCELLKQSPDYIIEKYYHWIGFEPTIEHKIYTPDDMTDFFHKYCKIWRPDTECYHKLKNILMYLYSTQNLSILNMSEKFEEYIGPMTMISDAVDKPGLHHKTNDFVNNILEGNKNNIKVVLRDMKIKSVLV